MNLHEDNQVTELFKCMKGIPTRKQKCISNNLHIVGSTSKTKLQGLHLNTISAYLGHEPDSYLTFTRLRIGSEIFHSRRYKRAYARNSYTIAYSVNDKQVEYGQIELYLQLYTHIIF